MSQEPHFSAELMPNSENGTYLFFYGTRSTQGTIYIYLFNIQIIVRNECSWLICVETLFVETVFSTIVG